MEQIKDAFKQLLKLCAGKHVNKCDTKITDIINQDGTITIRAQIDETNKYDRRQLEVARNAIKMAGGQDVQLEIDTLHNGDVMHSVELKFRDNATPGEEIQVDEIIPNSMKHIKQAKLAHKFMGAMCKSDGNLNQDLSEQDITSAFEFALKERERVKENGGNYYLPT